MINVVNVGIGLAVLFLLLAFIVMPNYNTAGDVDVSTNKTPYGPSGGIMPKAVYNGILLLVFFLAMIGIAMSFWKGKK